MPEGLTATYERICQKIARHSLRQRSLAERIFNWTICARRPLRFEELKEAVAIDLDDISWDRKKISAETDGKRFLCVCGNLAVYHERDNTVRLAHHTVEKFFVQHKKQFLQTDATIGEICLTYLSFSDFETQVSPIRTHDIFGSPSSRQASFYLILQLLGISNAIYDFLAIPFNWKSGHSLPEINYAELARRYRKQPLPHSLAQKYQLLDYVAANWIWHAKSFDQKMSECWSRFSHFVFQKSLPFDFRSWETLKGPSNLPHIAIYLWALANNHMPLLLVLKDLPESGGLRPYLEYKVLCPDRILVRPNVLTRDLSVAFRECPGAYDWPVMKALLEGTAEMRELCLQEDPSILSNRYVMTSALSDTNSGLLKSLIRGGATWKKIDVDTSHALHNAIRRGDQALVKMLLNIGADPNYRLFHDDGGWTPLFEAIMSEVTGKNSHRELHLNSQYLHSTLDLMQLLLDCGANPNDKQIGGETALHKAISLGEAYVRLLLSRGADVNARNDQQQSILDLAVDTSDRMIEVLVDFNVDLEAKDSDGQSALLKTIKKRPDDAVRAGTLIRHGADVHVKDLQGRTVLHYLRSSTDGTLLRLLELGVDVNAEDDSGARPIDCAVDQNDNAKYRLLLESGGVQGEGSAPPLIMAALRENIELINLVLRTGTDPNLLGNSEMSALSSAVKKKYREVVTTLLKAGADPNLVDRSRVTPLCRAVKSRDQETVRVLIEAGARIHPPDDTPYSPMYFAIGSGDISMVELLFQQGADVSRMRPSDLSDLRTSQVRMCDFVKNIGVPFEFRIEED